MNKLTIPAILVATVMVAGAFAFMPVEQASTVHTTITSTSITAVIGTGLDLDGGDNFAVTNFDVAPFYGGYFIVDVTAIGDANVNCDIDLLVVESDTAQDLYSAGSLLIVDGSAAIVAVQQNFVQLDADTDLLNANDIDVTVSVIDDGGAGCNADTDIDITVSIVGKSGTT